MAKRKLEHPAIEHLSAMPEVLRLLLIGVYDDEASKRSAPDRWSIAEVLEHLSHAEGHCYRARLDQMLGAENPDLELYHEQALALAGAYSDREAEESFAHWEEQREDNVEFLRELHAGVLTRTGRHPVLGAITVENLLNDWVCHDLVYVSQLAELVRTQVYAGSR
jgi:hypothetical protein